MKTDLFSQLKNLVLILAVFMGSAICVYADDFGRSKVIDFEDSLVEGVNKRPLDSLSQISDQMRKRKRPHLYRKRGGFRTENAESLSEMRFSQ